jgi:hypothetical protein
MDGLKNRPETLRHSPQIEVRTNFLDKYRFMNSMQRSCVIGGRCRLKETPPLLIVTGRIVQIADDPPTADDPGTDMLHIFL